MVTPINFFFDNFNDNIIDNDRWQVLQNNGGTTSETSGQLQVNIPSGSGWAQSGYVTNQYFHFNEHIIKVNVTNQNNLNQMILQICTTKVTNSDPANQDNWYRIMKTGANSFNIQRRINGGSIENPCTFTSSSQQLRIKIEEDTTLHKFIIRLDDGSSLGYSEEYSLPNLIPPPPAEPVRFGCYVYVFTSSNRADNNGSGAFDDFWISPIIKHLSDNYDDYNCYAGSTRQGQQGVTIWGPRSNDIVLPAGSTAYCPPLYITCTKPKCCGGKDFCNVSYKVHTDPSAPIKNTVGPIRLLLGNSRTGVTIVTPEYHSGIGGHDNLQSIDISQYANYDENVPMYLQFKNEDPLVDVSIQGLQIVRGYGMNCLDLDCTPPEEEKPVNTNEVAERTDYPCNYEACGRMSYTGYTHDNTYFQQVVNQSQPDGTILQPGTLYSWQWSNPPATFSGYDTYAGSAHCIFNFNPMYICDDNGSTYESLQASTEDIPFLVSLDNSTDSSHWATFYHCKNFYSIPHGIDLATHPVLKNYYNDAPGATNTLYFKIPNPDLNVNLFLHDGETGLINLYRVYRTKPCCPTITSNASAGGSIDPPHSAGALPIPQSGKQFIMSPNSGYYLSNVSVDGVSKGNSNPFTVHWTPEENCDLNWNVGIMQGHTISATFVSYTYEVDVTSDGNGDTSPSGINNYAHGTILPISGTPHSNYVFTHWTTSNPSYQTIADPNAQYTTVTINGPGLIEAHYQRINCYLQINCDSNGGYITQGSSGWYAYGSDQYVWAESNEGFIVHHWTDNGNETQQYQKYIHPTMTQDHTVEPIFVSGWGQPATVGYQTLVNEGIYDQGTYYLCANTWNDFTPGEIDGCYLYAWIIDGSWGGNLLVWIEPNSYHYVQYFYAHY
jgi:hypothetical protein